jgi:hypothetical protein
MLLRKIDFAQKLGVVPDRITELISEGMPVHEGKRIDTDAACAWIRANYSADSKIYQAVAGDYELSPANPDSVDGFLDNLLKRNFSNKADAERIKENALAELRTLELKRQSRRAS